MLIGFKGVVERVTGSHRAGEWSGLLLGDRLGEVRHSRRWADHTVVLSALSCHCHIPLPLFPLSEMLHSFRLDQFLDLVNLPQIVFHLTATSGWGEYLTGNFPLAEEGHCRRGRLCVFLLELI